MVAAYIQPSRGTAGPWRPAPGWVLGWAPWACSALWGLLQKPLLSEIEIILIFWCDRGNPCWLYFQTCVLRTAHGAWMLGAGGERHRWDPDLEPQRGYTAAAVHIGLC